MQLTAVLTLCLCLQVSAEGFTQTITFSGKDVPLEKVFTIIKQQTGYLVSYKAGQVRKAKPVNIHAENMPLDLFLNQALQNQQLEFAIELNTIFIKQKVETYPHSATQPMLDIILSGRVTNATKEPLEGVSVTVKGTHTGATTNEDGRFQLSVPSAANVDIVISFVGYETQTVKTGSQTIFNIVMAEEVSNLNEVVVVGYGSQKKVNLTGAVGVATSERLKNRPIADVSMGLQGVIPNLNISIRNGDPTSEASFNIRGFTSINGGSPLILVDGVPLDLQLVNPDDIESVTVLKDASSAAIYGARAAFGVILVETKKGKGKINVTFSTAQSIAKPILKLNGVTNPHEFVMAWNEAYNRTFGKNYYDDDYVAGTEKWVENPTDQNAWGVHNGELRFYGFNDYRNKAVTDFAPQQKYDVSISGSTKATTFYTSFGFLNKDGYLKNSAKNEKFKRYNVLMKSESKINNWLSLDEKIQFNSQVSNKPHFYNWDANINSVARMAPVMGLEFPDLPYYLTPGDHDQYERYIGLYLNHTDFLPYLENGGRTNYTVNDTWLTQGVTLTPSKGLKIRSDFSYNFYTRNYQDVASQVQVFGDWRYADLTNPTISTGYSGDDYIQNQNSYNQYYVWNAYAEQTGKIGNHNLKAMVGYNQEFGYNTSIQATAKSLITSQITDLNSTTGTQQTAGGKSQVALRSAFYRLNYNYKERYLLESNGRYDGTSRFNKNGRFGFFPSISAGWRISNEPFMGKANGWIQNLKLRASYGQLGNQLLAGNYYPYISTMTPGVSDYIMSDDRIPYISPASLISPFLSWEKVSSVNLGLDFTIIDNRLDVSGDIYSRDTKDMLMKEVYPIILGTNAPLQNAANLRTKGWELSATWRNKIGRNWSYAFNLALSNNQTRITKYNNPTGDLAEYYVGQKIGEIWGYVTEGIFDTEDKLASHADQSKLGSNWRVGDIMYTDLNKDGEISPGSNTLKDPGDRKIIGNSSPRYSFGINSDISYKNWSLNLFFQGLFREYLPDNGSHSDFYPFNSFFFEEKYFLTETWSPENPNAYFAAPHVSANGHGQNILPQSRYVQNASYIRLKNLTLNYNLPYSLIEKFRISKAQFYFSGMNLWEFTKMHKPLDPESVFTVTQEYYLQRIYNLGLKVTL